jgi:hypothetical protein
MGHVRFFDNLAVTALTLLLSVSAAHALTVRGTPVTVMNTAPDGGSVPVTGSVAITNTVPVSGTVGISGPVTLSGGVLSAENPDRSPYQESVSVSITTPYVNNFASFPTPSGYRFILQWVSITCTTPSNADSFPNVYLNVSKNVPSGTIGFGAHVISMEKRGTSFFGGYVWSGTANILAYADPSPYVAGGGSAIALNIFHTDTTVVADCSAIITGHTISNP